MKPQALKDLLDKYRLELSKAKPDEKTPKIHVDEIASKVAVFYERIRSLIDYQEEHLLRKNFINRILRRRLLLKNLSLNKNIAEPLIKEIIRAGRLPNDTVPEAKIGEIQKIIDNFLALVVHLRKLKDPREEEIYDWLVKITGSAIEENLFPPVKDEMLSEFMFRAVRGKLVITGLNLTEDEINLQLFIGVQRALLRVDEDQLNYRLLKFIYPNWNNLDSETLAKTVADLPAIKKHLEKLRRHPSAKYFYKLCNYFNTVFYIIGDIVNKGYAPVELEAVFEDEKALEKEVKAAYNERYEKQKSRLHRIALFSVISIFLSKILIALAVEIPIDKYVTGDFYLPNLLLNIAIPPLLMFIIVLSIKMPSAVNFTIVLNEVKAVCGFQDGKEYTIKAPRKKKFFTWAIIHLLYFAVFLASFYWLTLILLSIKFSISNIVIFAFFTSLVAATGVKVHNRSKEISMEEKKPRFLMFLLDVFALPFITVGKWGLSALSRMNVLVIIFNLIIELPFQIFIEFVENFRAFIKGQKDELQ